MTLDLSFWSGAGLVAVLGLIASAIGALWTSTREHERWIRDKRLAAASTLAGIMEATNGPQGAKVDRLVLGKAIADVELLGPPEVSRAMLVLLERANATKRVAEPSPEGVRYQEALTAFYDEVAKATRFKR